MEFTEKQIEKLALEYEKFHNKEIRLWEKNGMKRYYVKLKPFMFFATIDYYNTGSVKSCSVKDEWVSNSMGRGLKWALDFGKAYFDMNKMEFVVKDVSEFWLKLLIEFFEKEIAELN